MFSAARQDLATSYTTAPVVGLLVDDIVEAREELAQIQSVANMNGYRFFHLRGPDANVYAMVEGSSALRR